MAKYLLVALLILVILQIMRYSRRSEEEKKNKDNMKENMVTCAYCQVNFPQGEQILDGGLIFCSEEHRAAFFD